MPSELSKSEIVLANLRIQRNPLADSDCVSMAFSRSALPSPLISDAASTGASGSRSPAKSRAAATRRTAEVAATAEIHYRNQLEPCGVGDMVVGARDHDLAGFERLAQRIKHWSCEFGEFVEKQDAAMSQGNLAGARPSAATDKRGHRGGVVRVTKRARLDQPAGGKLAGNRIKHC